MFSTIKLEDYFDFQSSDILIYLQRSQRVLLTDNRKSMPQHLEVH